MQHLKNKNKTHPSVHNPLSKARMYIKEQRKGKMFMQCKFSQVPPLWRNYFSVQVLLPTESNN